MFNMLWKAYDPLGPLWLRVPSFLRGFGVLFCSCKCFDFRRAVVNPTSLWFWVMGFWGVLIRGQMQISGILRCSILFPRGLVFPGFLNAVWVMAGWQCWLGCFPLSPYLPLVCLSLRL